MTRLGDYLREMRDRRRRRPWEYYEPGDQPHGGLARFHAAPQRVRCLFPGNRFGKTTALGLEAAWRITNTHPHRTQLRNRTPIGVWIASQYKQFEILLHQQLCTYCFGWDEIEWNGSDNMLVCPRTGGRLYIVPSDRPASYIAGINPDFIIGDEIFPHNLYNELKARTFGDRATDMLFGVTACYAEVEWMKEEFYAPWLAHHGGDEDRACQEQSHPDVWCLPRGGIADNRIFTPEDVARFRAQTWAGGEKEWRVRNFGGFARLTGQGIFDEDALAWQLTQMDALDAELGVGVLGRVIVGERPRHELDLSPVWPRMGV